MLCQLYDLTATIIDFCGLNIPEVKNSILFKPYLIAQSDDDISDEVVSELNDWKMVLDKKIKKIYESEALVEVCSQKVIYGN